MDGASQIEEAGAVQAADDDLPLFRAEVLQARVGPWMGAIILPQPLSSWLLTGAACLIAAAVLGFLFLGSYTRREGVQGQLVPAKGLLPVTARSAGVVTAIRVHEGETVAENQVLVELSGETSSLSGGQTEGEIIGDLRAQLRELEALSQSQQQVTAQQRDSLASRLALLEQQLVEIDRQSGIEQEKIGITTRRLEKLQGGAKAGTFSGIELEAYQAQILNGSSQINALGRQRLDAEQQRSILQAQLQQLPVTAEAQADELHLRILSTKQSLAQSEARRAVALRAPGDGQVTNLAVQAGQPVLGGQRLLSILPQGSPLQAELWLPSRAVGFIDVGDRVVLRYPAFPYQKFGRQWGWVQELSRSATAPSELTSLLGRTISEPLYRVLVRLDRQTVDVYGRPELLKPGMVADADVLLERRRLIEWVFEPLYGAARSPGGAASAEARGR